MVNSTRLGFVRSSSLWLVALVAFATVGFLPSSGRADTLVHANFDLFAPFSVDTDPNSTATLTAIGLDGFGKDPSVGNPPWSMHGDTTYSNLGDARTNNQVVQFTLAPHEGYTLSLSSVSFDIAALRVPSATAAQTSQAFIYTDVDADTPVAAGFATDSDGTSGSGPSPFTNWSSLNLSGNPDYQNVAGTITFSIYFFDRCEQPSVSRQRAGGRSGDGSA